MKRPDLYQKRHSRGLTLVELMIAMVLSIVLLGGTIAIFLSSKQAYRTQEDLARIQENLRYGISRFMREVSAAGYMGCSGSVQKANVKVANTVALADYSDLISGEEGSGHNGTDKLTLRFARAGSGVPVIGAMTSQTDDVLVDSGHPNYGQLQKDRVVAISDCDAIAVFMITNEPDASGILKHAVSESTNTEADLQHKFGGTTWASATVYGMDGVTFELKKQTTDGKTVSSLHATRVGGNDEPILAGVEDFQVQYGIDLAPKDGTADRYLPWDQVPAAQVNEITSLLIRMTVNPGLPVAGETGENKDFRKTAEFVVKLRNRTGDA